MTEITFQIIVLGISSINLVILIFIIRELLISDKKKGEIRLKKKLEQIKEIERKKLIDYVSSELHDNIAQLASLAMMNVAGLKILSENEKSRQKLLSVLSKLLNDIKYLSKTIQLNETNETDINRQIDELFNIMNYMTSVTFSKEGQIPLMSIEKSNVLFRVLQELLNNLIKHSKASSIKLLIEIPGSIVTLSLLHDGIDFAPSTTDFNIGQGLRNLSTNIKLLNAEVIYEKKATYIILKIDKIV